ncbi:Hypothetical_protein [Hexamita inflata]|uniref:Hypothetical_protein n=1 Tax=Hexamita inflata TaxID=28002 RepID=A0AA86UB66_9EUKA|nr:Hypothetical protein HINF_LOCUS38460 [Hexamita inflata]
MYLKWNKIKYKVIVQKCTQMYLKLTFFKYKQHVYLEGVGGLEEVEWDHVEVALEFTTWALDGDLLLVDGEGYFSWDVDGNGVLEMHFAKEREWLLRLSLQALSALSLCVHSWALYEQCSTPQ